MKKVQTKKPISIGLVSLGCSKNAVDLQVMAGHLLKRGCVLAPNPDQADVILVNTCAFIESAREEAAAEILRACDLKRAGQCRAVIVSGCFAQRYGDRFAEVFPDVDAVVGIDALDKISAVVKQVTAEKPSTAKSVENVIYGGCWTTLNAGAPMTQEKVFDSPSPALRFTGQAFAYLKIAEGCAHRCAYCAIPAIRGNYRSRALKSILAEAKALLATGVKELNVIAQDPMLYGVDLGMKNGLVELLTALDKLKGEFWIRVLYSYPSEITDAFLSWLATSPHAAKYVDVPLQHTDPRILKAMARGVAAKATLEAAERIRAAVPGVTLRTTVMTGFPGETSDSFAKLLMDVKRMQFDHLGAFAFSPEEGTVAAEMAGRPLARTAEKRRVEVMAAQKKIWAAKAKKFVGKTFKALVTAPGEARLESQAPDVDGFVRIPAATPVGEFVMLRITRVRGYDFDGVVEART